MAFSISNTAPTTTPNNLNGRSSSHINGYNIKTAIANGKEIIANITQRIKVNINHSNNYYTKIDD